MDILVEREKTSLRLNLDGGLVDGKERVISKSFNNIKEDASNQALYESGTILSSLQNKDLKGISKIEVSALIKA